MILPSKYPDLDELAFEPFWAVWCVNDRAWCGTFRGSRPEAVEELKHWISGERAALNPIHTFFYEVRFNIRAALSSERMFATNLLAYAKHQPKCSAYNNTCEEPVCNCGLDNVLNSGAKPAEAL